jgi:virginiamycin B lyase
MSTISKLRMVLAVSACAMIPIVAQTAPAPTLPGEGKGKELVQQICTQCHNLNQIINSSGYSKAHWQELIGNMADLNGSPQQRDQILDYLATNFPPNQKRAPKPVAGDLKINVQSWKAPTLGQRARDPAMTPDGAIWWTGQYGNLVGRINPQTGEMKEITLPPGTRPHSITPDPQGNVWYMGNANGTIGRIDGKTHEVKVYNMPDPAAKDPHTGEFDQKGNLIFSVQNAQMVGKLEPSSGKVTLVKVPAPDKNPYGVKIDRQGIAWFGCSESNCILRLDPATMQLTEMKLPMGSTVRRLAFTSDGMLWYGNSGLGTVGRMDTKTGATKEWPSPSGPKSDPYGFEIINDIVWYNESGTRPDMLVRFDPKTEKFQSWPIASGNVHSGIVRHMRGTPNGDLLIHQSATNRIMRVSVTK